MSIHRKNRVCLLERWEVEELRRDLKPNCRNHRHISKAEAFELSGNPRYGKIVGLLQTRDAAKPMVGGYFVEIAGRIEFTITNPRSEPPSDLIRAEGLRLEKRHGIPFIERKVILREI